MRTITPALAAALLLLAALVPLGAAPARAQAAPAPAADADGGDDKGGSGSLPGAQFQRRLGGGPGFVCTATNALHDQQCTASCRPGQTADCVDAEGSGVPSCSCAGG